MQHIKETEAGIMYTTTLDGVTCYDIFTKAGFYRGGKTYNAEKNIVILTGKCELITEEIGIEVRKILTPESGITKIPAGIPNLFYFPVDSRVLEWFPEGTTTEDYLKYREMKK